MLPNWTETCSVEDLRLSYGIKFKGFGWYCHNETDWLLVRPYKPAGKFHRDRGLMIMCWNGSDPRSEIRSILQLPEFK